MRETSTAHSFVLAEAQDRGRALDSDAMVLTLSDTRPMVFPKPRLQWIKNQRQLVPPASAKREVKTQTWATLDEIGGSTLVS
jgi:hypothetical protein